VKQYNLKVVAAREARSTMSEIKRRHFLREKEAIQLLNDVSEKLNIDLKQLFEDKIQVEEADTPIAKIFFINNKPLLAIFNSALVLTLFSNEILDAFPRIVVNMGAVPHLCNGADLMAPGVVRIEKDYSKGNYVVVVDERHSKPLAIAIALEDSQTARNMTHGKIARNIHFVGDKLWSQLKKERL
jgi:PUA domain protein